MKVAVIGAGRVGRAPPAASFGPAGSPTCDAWADDVDVATAVDRVQAIAHLPVDRVIASLAGLRTFAPDRLPVVGWAEGSPGLLWLAGQGGFGLQTAPALASLAASIVLLAPTQLRAGTVPDSL